MTETQSSKSNVTFSHDVHNAFDDQVTQLTQQLAQMRDAWEAESVKVSQLEEIESELKARVETLEFEVQELTYSINSLKEIELPVAVT